MSPSLSAWDRRGKSDTFFIYVRLSRKWDNSTCAFSYPLIYYCEKWGHAMRLAWDASVGVHVFSRER